MKILIIAFFFAVTGTSVNCAHEAVHITVTNRVMVKRVNPFTGTREYVIKDFPCGGTGKRLYPTKAIAKIKR